MTFGEMQKVLVADDDAINRMVLGELLKPEYTVVLAKNGAQTLERAARHAPDLILLDVMMPELDSLATLESLRRMPHLADTPALFVTGLTNASDIERYADAGAIGVIPKPLVPLKLTDQLRTLWEQHQLGHPNA